MIVVQRRIGGQYRSGYSFGSEERICGTDIAIGNENTGDEKNEVRDVHFSKIESNEISMNFSGRGNRGYAQSTEQDLTEEVISLLKYLEREEQEKIRRDLRPLT